MMKRINVILRPSPQSVNVTIKPNQQRMRVKLNKGNTTGAGLEYKWSGSQLGVKTSDDEEYQFTDLKGEAGGADRLDKETIVNVLGFAPQDYKAGENVTIENGVIKAVDTHLVVSEDDVVNAMGYKPAKEENLLTPVPPNALFTDTIVDISGKANIKDVDVELDKKADVNYVDNKLNGKVDNSKVLTDVPKNALFTDTVVDISNKADVSYVDKELGKKANLDHVESSLSNKVDNSRVLTDVPTDALFTDTNTTYTAGENIIIGEDNVIHAEGEELTDIAIASALGYTPVNKENLLTPVPENAIFTDTKVDVIDNLESDDSQSALSARQGKELFQSVSNGKDKIAVAITDQGIETSNSDTFDTMANNISSLELEGIGYQVGDYIEKKDVRFSHIEWKMENRAQRGKFVSGGDGYLYWFNNQDLKKIDPKGGLIWHRLREDRVRGLAVDVSGVYYTIEGSIVYKMSPNGEQIWYRNNSRETHRYEDIAIGEDGIIRLVGAQGTGRNTYAPFQMLRDNGLVFRRYRSRPTPFHATRIVMCNNNNSWICNTTKWSFALIDNMAEEIFSIHMRKTMPDYVVDSLNNMYTIDLSGRVYKLNSTGRHEWEDGIKLANKGSTLFVDKEDYLHIVDNKASSYADIIKVDSNGNVIERYGKYNGSITHVEPIWDNRVAISYYNMDSNHLYKESLDGFYHVLK